jgi:hypothetical protein
MTSPRPISESLTPYKWGFVFWVELRMVHPILSEVWRPLYSREDAGGRSSELSHMVSRNFFSHLLTALDHERVGWRVALHSLRQDGTLLYHNHIIYVYIHA